MTTREKSSSSPDLDHPPSVRDVRALIEHDWKQPDGYNWPFCQTCGIVQRRDGQNEPCKGPTRLRPMEGSDE